MTRTRSDFEEAVRQSGLTQLRNEVDTIARWMSAVQGSIKSTDLNTKIVELSTIQRLMSELETKEKLNS